MKSSLLKKAQQNCPAALTVFGELAIADVVNPVTKTSLRLQRGIQRAQVFFEQVYDVTKGKSTPEEISYHANASYTLGVLGFVQDTSTKRKLGSLPEPRTSELAQWVPGPEIDVHKNRLDALNRSPSGLGRVRTDKSRLHYFEVAAELDQGDALLFLAYLKKVGSQFYDIPIDPEGALDLLHRACDLGHNGARIYMSQRYRFGDKTLSIVPDISTARKYLQPALHEKDCWAMFVAGDDAGGIKTARSYSQAHGSGPQPNTALSWYLRTLPHELYFEPKLEFDAESVDGMSPLGARAESNGKGDNENSLSIPDDGPSVEQDGIGKDGDIMRNQSARLYLFDDKEWFFSHENLIEPQMDYDTSARVSGSSPPLLYGCGRQLLHQMLGGDTIGQARCLLRAGIHLHNGFGVPKNVEKAQKMWTLGSELDPWNTTLMDVVHRTSTNGRTKRAMAMRQQYGIKFWSERPFPEHWGHESNTPAIISSEDNFDAFMNETKLVRSSGHETTNSESPSVGFILCTTGWATMAWLEEHAVHDRDGATSIRRIFEKIMESGCADLSKQGTTRGSEGSVHRCIFGAVDLSVFPDFLASHGYIVDQCPTIIVVYNGEVHSQYAGLPDEQFEVFYNRLRHEAPLVNDMCTYVRRSDNLDGE
jgi:TPR repeat protein